MGMLDRYKKKGGFVQLLNLLETSSKTKQDQFLALISQESPLWEVELKKRLLSVDKIVEWPRDTLNEIISRIQPLTLAVALRHFDQPKKEEITSVLTQSDKRKILNLVDETNPNPAEIATCLHKIVIETRALVQLGVIKLEKFNPDLIVPENIEELINQKQHGQVTELDSKETQAKEVATDSDDEDEVKLDFSGASRNHGPSSDKLDSLKDENDFLKRKVNQLTHDMATIRSENAVLRGKLDQIKKIA